MGFVGLVHEQRHDLWSGNGYIDRRSWITYLGIKGSKCGQQRNLDQRNKIMEQDTLFTLK